MRKICYLTGTRADFGLMENALLTIDQHPCLELGVIVTGMHLLSDYGQTWREIESCGLNITAKIPVLLSGRSGAEMATALGEQLIGITRVLQQQQPDILLLLGDRGEMLAGAIAALHLNIHIVHIHGGELSGTIDESFRHAISKIAHYHFVATENSRKRLLRMGEKAENIFVTGAPGLDAILQLELLDRSKLFQQYGLDESKPLLLVLFHPVIQQVSVAARQMEQLMLAVVASEMQSLVLLPNADAGGAAILKVINAYATSEKIETTKHLSRAEFLSFLAYSEVFVGNSSSGIIEAASLATPVVNIGDRQQCRERNANTIDVRPEKNAISAAINDAIKMKGQQWVNIYGDGNSSPRIADLLQQISLAPEILEKVNGY
jgi:GDP/UDP-N,N'-diacetylbacillosamine 2-epimerase (hydrolysing)